MTASRQRLALLPLLAAGYAASCAVFPDEAVLPASNDTNLGGGGSSSEAAGASAEAGSAVVSGGAGGGPVDGAGNGGQSAAGNGGAGGAIEPSAGAAGEAGAGGAGILMCDEPLQMVVPVTDDTWIEAANDGANHGSEKQLFVEGGAAELRALLKVEVPPGPAGAWLVKATLTLYFESNRDPTLAARRLGLHRLTKDFNEGKASWSNFSNGANNKWDAAGGDFGASLARTTLPAGSSAGPLSFDVTKPLALVYSAQAVPLGLIIREVGPVPNAPAALAFTSSEGNASLPTLVIEYCEP